MQNTGPAFAATIPVDRTRLGVTGWGSKLDARPQIPFFFSIGPGSLSPGLPSIHLCPHLGWVVTLVGAQARRFFFFFFFYSEKELPALTSDYRRNALSKVWSVSLHPWALTFHAICLSQRKRTRVGRRSVDRRYER